jgi:Zn-dependent M16 (insulinase) family peptidase
MAHWFYGGDPAAEFDIYRTYSRLRQGVDTGLFEKCLKEMLIDNSHHVELTFSPDISLKGVVDKRAGYELARKKSMMSEAEVLSLKKELEELLAYQNREDSKSAKSTIPSLRVSDIPSSGRIVDHVSVANGDSIVFKTQPTSKGVVYFTVYFPIDDLNAAQLVKVPLLARLLGKLPTHKHDVLSLQTELMSTAGRIEYSTLAAKRGNFLRVKVATLASKDMDTLNLMKEVLCETRFDDISMIAKVHKQKLLSAERNVRTRGDNISKSVASRQISRRWASDDVLHGLEQLKWLQKTEITTDVAKELGELARKIFAGGNIVISYTDNMSIEAESTLRTMFNSFDARERCRSEISFTDADIEAIEIDGDTGYSGTISTLPDGCLYNGSMAVAAKIISLEHLYKEIREKGGAYGTGMTISPSGRISAYTYRNPTPLKSFDVIVKSGDALRSFLNSDCELDRYIVATIAGMDPCLPPEDEAFEPVELYITERSFKDKEADRKEVIGTTRDDLLKIAEILHRQLGNSKHFIVGGKSQTKDISVNKIKKVEK